MPTETPVPTVSPDTSSTPPTANDHHSTDGGDVPRTGEEGKPEDNSENGTPVGETARQQFERVRELPSSIFSFLVRSAPPRQVWQWLGEDDQFVLRRDIARGFQNTANALRQPAVRTRLANQLREDSKAFYALVGIWGNATPAPVVAEIRELVDDATLIEQLPALRRRHGSDAVVLALLLDDRSVSVDAWNSLLEAESPGHEVAAPPAQPENVAGQDQHAQTDGRHVTGKDNGKVKVSAIEPLPDDDAAALKTELDRTHKEAEEWRRRSAAAETALTASQEQLHKAQGEVRARDLKLKQETRRAEASEVQLQETKRALDRTERRLRRSEKEATDAGAEIKRLQRQMRRQQQLNEELRKQLAHVTAKLQAQSTGEDEADSSPKARDTAQPPTSPASSTQRTAAAQRQPISPLDQPFIWKSDGRPFQVTPREIKRAIDGNNEEYVFTLIQAFDALRESNKPGYKMLLERVQQFGRYYSRVLTRDTTRVLVDASNVARYESNRFGKGQLHHLLVMRDELRRLDCFPILMYADASLPYNIDEPGELMGMVRRGEVEITQAGQEADELLAREARRTGAYVVTNDRGFHLKVTPDFEPPRITFRIDDGTVILDDF